MNTKIRSIISKVTETAVDVARKASVASIAPTEKQAQLILFTAGIIALGAGLSHEVFAYSTTGAIGGNTAYDDRRIANAVSTIFAYLEGSFGALIMAASGIGAIVSASFGNYKMALSCLVVAVGSFILRSMMNTFFNIQGIIEDGDSAAGT